MNKFKKDDVVVLHNPNKSWSPETASKLHGEVAIVTYRLKNSQNGYDVMHLYPGDEEGEHWIMEEHEMEKIGVL